MQFAFSGCRVRKATARKLAVARRRREVADATRAGIARRRVSRRSREVGLSDDFRSARAGYDAEARLLAPLALQQDDLDASLAGGRGPPVPLNTADTPSTAACCSAACCRCCCMAVASAPVCCLSTTKCVAQSRVPGRLNSCLVFQGCR